MGILIKNGTVVTSSGRWTGDVRCRDGRIVELGEGLDAKRADRLLDASGQLVLPGGIDPHVHMELPVLGTHSADDFESGTAAGLAGGTTSIIDFVTPARGEDMLAALDDRKAAAAGAVADYGLHMSVTSWEDRTADWMRRCVEEEGIPSFKTYMAYLDTIGIDDAELIYVMRTACELGALVTVHAELGEKVDELREEFGARGFSEPRFHALSRPAAIESEAAMHAIMLAQQTGAALYVVHVSCRQTAEAIAEARARGQEVYGEACPQYLLLDATVYDRPDFGSAAYVMSPPIRPPGHQEPLFRALASDALQTVGTDHCPFNLSGQKELGRDDFRRIPNGAAGIQHRMALIYTHGVAGGLFDAEHYVRVTSTNAAKIFGLYPRKGEIAIGSDADLVVWDPEARGKISAATHKHHCDSNIFEGFETRGAPTSVVAGGRLVCRGGDLDVAAGAGRYLERSRVRPS